MPRPWLEDEAGARESLVTLLTSLGCEAMAAASGEEAEALPPEPVPDVLLSDLMLPGVSGEELARRLRRRWPDLRVVLMSGYAGNEALQQGIASGRQEFLEKPFGMETLARTLRRAPDQTPRD